MSPISSEIVEKTWREIGGESPEKVSEMVKRMDLEQPVILAYLMAAGSDMSNQSDREVLLYLGIVVWQIMCQRDTPLPKITKETLDKMEGSNMDMFEYLEEESDCDFIDTTRKILSNYSQPEVLKYVIEALMEPDEDCLIRDESKGIMMFYLKTVIDCFK